VDRVRVDAGTDTGGDAHAVLVHSGGAGRLEVRPLEPSPVIERVPYEEATLWAAARFAPGTVRLDVPSPFTFIATCVSLNKRLLLTDAPPQGPGQWLFAGLELTHHPDDWPPLALEREAFIAGRMAKTGLRVAGRLYACYETDEENQLKRFAQVAAGNAASLRTFLAAGFTPIGSEVLLT